MEENKDLLDHWPRVAPSTPIEEAAAIAFENGYGAVIVERDGCPAAVVVAPEMFRYLQGLLWGEDDVFDMNDPEVQRMLAEAEAEYEIDGGIDGDEVMANLRWKVGLAT